VTGHDDQHLMWGTLKARRIGPATAGTGARRSASKSSIALALTEAADASFAT
jgi:hypothetical protein